MKPPKKRWIDSKIGNNFDVKTIPGTRGNLSFTLLKKIEYTR
jgi:hypothetical protein